MFFDKGLTDCSTILDENPSLFGLPIEKRIWTKTSFSYPEHPDRDVTKRIELQKSIIEDFGVIEIIFSLSTAAEDFQEYFRSVRKLVIPRPSWHDPSNFKATGSAFILDGNNYLAEQYSSNFKCQLVLVKNGQPILSAHIGPSSPSQISILSSKLDKDDVQRLAVVANVIEKKRGMKHDTFFNAMIDRLRVE